MKIAILSDARFVEELNRELRRHPSFVVGMQFDAFPDDAPAGSLCGFSITASLPAMLADSILKATSARYGVRLQQAVGEAVLSA